MKDKLKKLIDLGRADLVLALALGNRNLEEIKDFLKNERLEDVKNLAWEVFGEYKCKGRHFWFPLKKSIKYFEDGMELKIRCYSCKIERDIVLKEIIKDYSKLFDRVNKLSEN